MREASWYNLLNHWGGVNLKVGGILLSPVCWQPPIFFSPRSNYFLVILFSTFLVLAILSSLNLISLLFLPLPQRGSTSTLVLQLSSPRLPTTFTHVEHTRWFSLITSLDLMETFTIVDHTSSSGLHSFQPLPLFLFAFFGQLFASLSNHKTENSLSFFFFHFLHYSWSKLTYFHRFE